MRALSRTAHPAPGCVVVQSGTREARWSNLRWKGDDASVTHSAQGWHLGRKPVVEMPGRQEVLAPGRAQQVPQVTIGRVALLVLGCGSCNAVFDNVHRVGAGFLAWVRADCRKRATSGHGHTSSEPSSVLLAVGGCRPVWNTSPRANRGALHAPPGVAWPRKAVYDATLTGGASGSLTSSSNRLR